MHPLIHLVSLLLFSLGLALGQWPQLWLGVGLLPGYWLLCGHGPGLGSWRMLRRLRWFFLSIVVIYLWFTPGQWLWPALAQWSPTYEGVGLALHRLAVLLLIVMAVATLLRTLGLSQLMAALRQLLWPLRLFGFPSDRFALRLALTVDASQRLLAGDREAGAAGERRGIAALAEALYQRFVQALQAPVAVEEIEIPLLNSPPWWQWGLPILMLLAFVGVS